MIPVFALALYLGARFVNGRPAPSFPGPRGLPVLGNLLDIPPQDAHMVYDRMAKKYGPIFQLKMLSKTLLVVTKSSIAHDLLDKRGSIYSDRPVFSMLGLTGWGSNVAFMRHGGAWRAQRRLLHQSFYANGIVHLQGQFHRIALQLMRTLLSSPENFRHHVYRATSATTIRSAYGFDIGSGTTDRYVEVAEKAGESLSAALPGSNLVDLFPFLQHLPAWVPGSPRKKVQESFRARAEMLNVLYARSMEDMTEGSAHPSIVTENLDAMKTDNRINEHVIKEAAAATYLGGTDTAASALIAFILAMVMWPECYRRAQEEIDRVVGPERLPDFSDRASLPYLDACITETFRRFPIAVGIPHAAEEDDVYQGVPIAKGTMIVANIWSMLWDEEIYPDPKHFKPERYLTESGTFNPGDLDPRINMFGFGRRVCPGRFYGDAFVFITVATLLKCFDISKAVENGVEVTPTGELKTQLSSAPAPFKCRIEPRSQNVESLIADAYEHCES
ncbi:cytochrome P450 [Auricularia subglabra TFB-10046 SS5]|nr:cytochrome P450 [Auricularia subglabra TFB-10046 SS5]